jgi:putative DNA primase/helicase
MESSSAIEQTVSKYEQLNEIIEDFGPMPDSASPEEFMKEELRLFEMGVKTLPVHYLRSDGSCSCERSECSGPKHPRMNDWQGKAQRDNPILIKTRREKAYRYSNLGISCGKDSGVFVLDVDVHKEDGFTTLRELSKDDPESLNTPCVRTPSGGMHYYFRYDENLEWINNMVKFAPGLDIRNTGSLVVAPPSRTADGFYKWEKPLNSLDDLKPVPTWLIQKLEEKASTSTSGTLDLSFDESGDIPQGARDNTLFGLGTLYMRQNPFGEKNLLQVLRAYNSACNPPLPDFQINKIATSVTSYTLKKRHELGDLETFRNACFAVDDKGKEYWSHTKAALAARERWPMITRLTDHGVPELLVYHDGTYKEGREQLINDEFAVVGYDKYKNGRNNQTFEKIYTYTRPEKTVVFDEDPYLVCVENKILDFKNQKIYDHDPSFHVTVKSPVYYDPLATCEDFVAYLLDVTGDPVAAQSLLDIITISLFKRPYIVVNILIGEGRNGKSIFIKVLVAIVGKENTATPTLSNMTTSRFGTSELMGKLLAVYAEEDNGSYPTGPLKAVGGGDRIRGERKGKDAITFSPFASQIITSNNPPYFKDDSFAWQKRLNSIDFPYKFLEPADHEEFCKDKTPEEIERSMMKLADPLLEERLTTPEMLSGILNLCFKNATHIFNRNDIVRLKTYKETKEDYDVKTSTMKSFFEEFCEHLNEVGTYGSKDIYEYYKMYCEVYHVGSQSFQRFSRYLSELDGTIKGRTNNINKTNISLDILKLDEFLQEKNKGREYTSEELRDKDVCEEIIAEYERRKIEKKNSMAEITIISDADESGLPPDEDADPQQTWDEIEENAMVWG